MNSEIIIAILLGIGLSASSGFRVFIPLLVASVSAYFGWLPIGESFSWLGSTPAMVCFGVAAIIEVLSYYIPVVDNLLDTISGPLALIAGTLLTVSVLPIDGDLSRWTLGVIVGGGSAGTVQAGTSALRLLSTKGTLTTANPILATTENVGAAGGSIFAIAFPVLAGIVFIGLIVLIVVKILRWRKRKL